MDDLEFITDSSSCSDVEEEERGASAALSSAKTKSHEKTADKTVDWALFNKLRAQIAVRKQMGLLVKYYNQKKFMVVRFYVASEPESSYNVCLKRNPPNEGWKLFKHRMPYWYEPQPFEPGSPLSVINGWLRSQLHVIQCYEQRTKQLTTVSDDKELQIQFNMMVTTIGSIELQIRFVLPTRKRTSREKKERSSAHRRSGELPKVDRSVPIPMTFLVTFSWHSIAPLNVAMFIGGFHARSLEYVWKDIANENFKNLNERVAKWISVIDNDL